MHSGAFFIIKTNFIAYIDNKFELSYDNEVEIKAMNRQVIIVLHSKRVLVGGKDNETIMNKD